MSESVEVVRQKEIVTRMRELNSKVIAERDALAAELEAIEIAKDVEVELRMRDQARIAALEAALDECCHDWRDTKVWLTNSAIGRAARGFTSETTVQPSPDGTQMGVWRQGYPSLDDPPETEAKDG